MEQDGGLRQKNFNPDHCSPSSDITDGSCLDRKLLIQVSKALNKICKDNKIDCTTDTPQLHENICKCMHKMTGCSSESCWLNFKKLLKKLGKNKEKFINSFKPIMPEEWLTDYNSWLTTDDIENCLIQYENAKKEFYFYGAVPIDFSKCHVSNLCRFNLKKHIQQGHKKIGIVFNTDPHTEDGEHWISMYVDINGQNLKGIPGIYYFDSYGLKPCKEVNYLIKKIKKQGKLVNKQFKYFYNDKNYQKRDAQCGMYSIHFIKEMLKGLSFDNFLDSGLSDKKMIQKRNLYFIEPSKIKKIKM